MHVIAPSNGSMGDAAKKQTERRNDNVAPSTPSTSNDPVTVADQYIGGPGIDEISVRFRMI